MSGAVEVRPDSPENILFDMDDDVGALGRLLQAMILIGRAASDRQIGDAVEEVADVAWGRWDSIRVDRLKAWQKLAGIKARGGGVTRLRPILLGAACGLLLAMPTLMFIVGAGIAMRSCR